MSNEEKKVAASGPTGMETVMGGGTCVVLINGVAESVVVRQLPICEFEALRKSLNDEVWQVALYCGKERMWAEGLRPADHELIIREGERINRDFFERWLERKVGREKFQPKQNPEELAALLGVVAKHNPDMLKQMVQKQTESLPSGLPGSARSAS